MAAVRKLPECDVLRGHVEDGMNNLEIAEMYGTTGEAVRQALVRCGVQRQETERRPRHNHYVPWKIRTNHTSDTLLTCLRLYSKKQQGFDLSATEARKLEKFIRFMEGGNSMGVPLSVHYDYMDPDGFWLAARGPGDRDYVSPPSAH